MNERPEAQELELRAAIKSELQEEAKADLAKQFDRNKAIWALVISTGIAITFALPFAGVLVGATVRLFFWASGLR